MKKNILGKLFLIVVAHPDDESFLAGGIIHENHIRGGKNYLLCASLGELGHCYVDVKISTSEIKKIRKQELLDVSAYLGVNKTKILNLPDGSISSHMKKLEREVVKLVLDLKPDYIVSFGEDGYTGHADHIVLYSVAKKVAQQYKLSFVQFAKPSKNICIGLDKHLLAKRKNGVYKDECVPSAVSNLKIKINPLVKLKALSLHQSQFAGLNPYEIFPTEIAEHFLNNEYFHISNP